MGCFCPFVFSVTSPVKICLRFPSDATPLTRRDASMSDCDQPNQVAQPMSKKRTLVSAGSRVLITLCSALHESVLSNLFALLTLQQRWKCRPDFNFHKHRFEPNCTLSLASAAYWASLVEPQLANRAEIPLTRPSQKCNRSSQKMHDKVFTVPEFSRIKIRPYQDRRIVGQQKRFLIGYLRKLYRNNTQQDFLQLRITSNTQWSREL